MSTGATTKFNIPLFGDDDFVTPIQSPLNSQSNAMETALVKGAYQTFPDYATLTLPANAGTIAGQHAYVNADSTVTNNGDYVWSGSAWVAAALALPATFSCHTTGSPTINSSWNLITSWATPDFIRNFSFSAGVLTVNQPGIYEVIACFSTSSNGTNSALVTKNSATANTGTIVRVQQGGLTAFGSALVVLAAGDQLRMFGAGPTASQTISTDATYFAVMFKSAR